MLLNSLATRMVRSAEELLAWQHGSAWYGSQAIEAMITEAAFWRCGAAADTDNDTDTCPPKMGPLILKRAGGPFFEWTCRTKEKTQKEEHILKKNRCIFAMYNFPLVRSKC